MSEREQKAKANIEAIKAEMERIAKMVEELQATPNMDWSHVGELGRIKNLLAEI